ncbi:MAG: hypothetical protein AAF489_10865 [Bacteroidota bacterium]
MNTSVKFKNYNANVIKTLFVLLLTFEATGLQAQDYSQQINSFKQSFEEKSVVPLKPFVSSELKFDPIPVANTPAILNNIVSNLPKLNSMKIIESSEGMAKIKYDFVGLGVRKSNVHFLLCLHF